MPGAYVCSASFRAKLDKHDVRSVTLGKRMVSSLFSSGQRRFFDAHAPDGTELDQLASLGLELSTNCRPDEVLEAVARTEVYRTDRGVDFGAEQATKTTTALNFFVAEVK